MRVIVENNRLDDLQYQVEPTEHHEKRITAKFICDKGWKPQQARQVLPNATKTELVMTGFESDWEGFFKLRCSGAAHPDAQKLANELKELLINVKKY